MGNRTDEYGTDVEIYVKALTSTIHADTPTDAPDHLLDLLDRLGFERQEIRTTGPVYTWHEVPARLDAAEQKRLVSRAIPVLVLAGYTLHCTPEAVDEDVYREAIQEIRSTPPIPSVGEQPTPAVAPRRPSSARRSL